MAKLAEGEAFGCATVLFTLFVDFEAGDALLAGVEPRSELVDASRPGRVKMRLVEGLDAGEGATAFLVFDGELEAGVTGGRVLARKLAVGVAAVEARRLLLLSVVASSFNAVTADVAEEVDFARDSFVSVERLPTLRSTGEIAAVLVATGFGVAPGCGAGAVLATGTGCGNVLVGSSLTGSALTGSKGFVLLAGDVTVLPGAPFEAKEDRRDVEASSLLSSNSAAAVIRGELDAETERDRGGGKREALSVSFSALTASKSQISRRELNWCFLSYCAAGRLPLYRKASAALSRQARAYANSTRTFSKLQTSSDELTLRPVTSSFCSRPLPTCSRVLLLYQPIPLLLLTCDVVVGALSCSSLSRFCYPNPGLSNVSCISSDLINALPFNRNLA